jgi:hypothetical protein
VGHDDANTNTYGEDVKMKSRVITLMLTLILFTSVIMTPMAQAHTVDDPFAVSLVAGGGNPKSARCAGHVRVWNNCSYLVIKFIGYNGWRLTETHLHIAASMEDIPQTSHGNPIPGQFDYKTEHENVEMYVYTIALEDLPEGCLVIAAHAVVENECEELSETAWGAGCDFPGRNWATYFLYCLQVEECPEPEPECPEPEPECPEPEPECPEETGGVVEEETGGVVEEETGGVVEEETGGVVEEETGGVVEEETGGVVEEETGGVVDDKDGEDACDVDSSDDTISLLGVANIGLESLIALILTLLILTTLGAYSYKRSRMRVKLAS